MADRRRSPLPDLPAIRLAVTADRSPAIPAGFLSLRRVEMVATFPDGTTSAPFVHDMVARRALDAVVLLAHYGTGDDRRVYLRSCLRPPVTLRPIPPPHSDLGALWEIPAGLIEPDEEPAAAGAREIEEELGFHVAAGELVPLGPPSFPASGLIGEYHYYFHVRVDPAARKVPSEDGSALERGAVIADISLADALALCREGRLMDAKTEIGLRRLAEIA